MKSFQDQCESLELQTFDPAALEGDANVPQELCNLVLAAILFLHPPRYRMYLTPTKEV